MGAESHGPFTGSCGSLLPAVELPEGEDVQQRGEGDDEGGDQGGGEGGDLGIIERRFYEEHPPRAEYMLTKKGRSLGPILKALYEWGQKHPQ